MKDELEDITEILEMLEIGKDYVSHKFELPDNLVPVPCTDDFGWLLETLMLDRQRLRAVCGVVGRPFTCE